VSPLVIHHSSASPAVVIGIISIIIISIITITILVVFVPAACKFDTNFNTYGVGFGLA